MFIVSSQYKFVKFFDVKLYMNRRLYMVFHRREAVLNITHTKETRIKADHMIIRKTVVAYVIATIY